MFCTSVCTYEKLYNLLIFFKRLHFFVPAFCTYENFFVHTKKNYTTFWFFFKRLHFFVLAFVHTSLRVRVTKKTSTLLSSSTTNIIVEYSRHYHLLEQHLRNTVRHDNFSRLRSSLSITFNLSSNLFRPRRNNNFLQIGYTEIGNRFTTVSET